MARVNIKETMRKSTVGTLDLDSDEILIEVEGFDRPLSFRDLYTHFNGREVRIDINSITEYKPEE